jgi:non-ribosomal peptide synthetase component F
VEVETDSVPLDLSLELLETKQGLRGSWKYRSDLFDAITISRLGEHFERLLEGIAADPGRPISDLPPSRQAAG